MFSEGLPFIENFIKDLNASLAELDPVNSLTKTQARWLSFCLMGILVTNKICWSRFYRASLGKYKISALSWMLKGSKIFWEHLLTHSILLILKKFKITSGCLVIDDTDKRRSKKTTKIYKAHKIFNKSTNGYCNGQSIVFLFLVSRQASIPVGFRFFCPDINLQEWEKKDKAWKKEGKKKADRPKAPARDVNCPTKSDLAISLLEEFGKNFPWFNVDSILADALYGSSDLVTRANKIYPKTQFISQLRSNQIVIVKNKKISVSEYFKKYKGVHREITVRGSYKKNVTLYAARLTVKSHGKKRVIIALKYEGEEEYRYLFASELAWGYLDIVECYTLRWLIEVFFQDWKQNEGWGELKLQGVEGSERALILSLLFDYSLFFHPDQLRLIENKLPASTVGSLLRKTRIDAFLQFLGNIISSENPEIELEKIKESISEIYDLMPSKKHMTGNKLVPIRPVKKLIDNKKIA